MYVLCLCESVGVCGWGCTCIRACNIDIDVCMYVCVYVHRRMRRGGQQPPPPQFFGQRRSFFWAAAMVGGGCFSIFRRADDVTRTMSKGGCACECPRVGVFFNFPEGE